MCYDISETTASAITVEKSIVQRSFRNTHAKHSSKHTHSNSTPVAGLTSCRAICNTASFPSGLTPCVSGPLHSWLKVTARTTQPSTANWVSTHGIGVQESAFSNATTSPQMMADTVLTLNTPSLCVLATTQLKNDTPILVFGLDDSCFSVVVGLGCEMSSHGGSGTERR